MPATSPAPLARPAGHRAERSPRLSKRSNFDRSDQKNQNSRADAVSPRGTGQTSSFSISLRCRLIRRRPARKGRRSQTCSFRDVTGSGSWWSQTGSNRRPHACKARALPTELWPLRGGRSGRLVGPGRLELPTSRLSGVRSNHLSYGPSGSRQRTGSASEAGA
jgi:hypothetical protein